MATWASPNSSDYVTGTPFTQARQYNPIQSSNILGKWNAIFLQKEAQAYSFWTATVNSPRT